MSVLIFRLRGIALLFRLCHRQKKREERANTNRQRN